MVGSAALTIMNLLENDPQLQARDIKSQNYHIELDPFNILGPSKMRVRGQLGCCIK